MKKKKIKLERLEVKSFVTKITKTTSETAKGGTSDCFQTLHQNCSLEPTCVGNTTTNQGNTHVTHCGCP